MPIQSQQPSRFPTRGTRHVCRFDESDAVPLVWLKFGGDRGVVGGTHANDAASDDDYGFRRGRCRGGGGGDG